MADANDLNAYNINKFMKKLLLSYSIKGTKTLALNKFECWSIIMKVIITNLLSCSNPIFKTFFLDKKRI